MQLTLKDRAGIYEGVCAVTKPIKTNVNIKVKVESNGNIHIEFLAKIMFINKKSHKSAFVCIAVFMVTMIMILTFYQLAVEIYAYGFISYAIFMRMFFYISKKLKSLYLYIPMISFFLCFTMNTMIGEQKLFIIFVLIGIILKKEAITNEKSFSNRSNL